MSRGAKLSLLALFVVLSLIGAFTQDDTLQLTNTSYGNRPEATGGLFELLAALDFEVARNAGPLGQLAPGATAWWIDPVGVCEASKEEEEDEDRIQADWTALGWIEKGGVALVFLTPKSACESIAGLALPVRNPDVDIPPDVEAVLPDEANPEEEPVLARAFEPLPEESQWEVRWDEGSPRALAIPELRSFRDAGEWRARAMVMGQPFVLERTVGEGRLVVVADSRFLWNGWLARADAAPLAVDFVRRYGDPILDERTHGLRTHQSTFGALATSSAVGVMAGLATLGVLFAWRGSALGLRTLPEEEFATPTLGGFVDSLASLYAQSQDYQSVFERYREITAARLRRLFGLASDAPPAVLAEKLRRQGSLSPARITLLNDGQGVASSRQLEIAMAELDALVEETNR